MVLSRSCHRIAGIPLLPSTPRYVTSRAIWHAVRSRLIKWTNVRSQQRFHFRTRRQELNSVEGGNRVNNDYLDQLAKFHKQNGHNLNRFPSVDKRPLDLYRLKKTVERKGGFDQVCKGKRWAEVGRDLGYSGKIMSSLSTSLKNSYQKWLLPYEEYLRVAKPGVQQQLEAMNGGPYTPSPGPSPIKKPPSSTPTGAHEGTPTMQAHAAFQASIHGDSTPPQPSRPQESSAPPPPMSTSGFTPVNVGGFTAVNAPTPVSSFTSVNGPNGFTHSNSATPQQAASTPPVSNGQTPFPPQHNGFSSLKRSHSNSILSAEEIEAMNRRSKRLRRDVPTVSGSNMHHSSHARMSASRQATPKERGDHRPGEACENCFRVDDATKLLRCDSCDSVYHRYCLEPPLKQKPDFEWHCPRCLVGSGEYGFEEGDVYSLAGFQRRANEFKQTHFQNIPRQFSPFTEHKRHLEEEDVEREFWRLTDELSESTEVEYGADIHCTTHGSGFPVIEKQPRDPYSTDPWNLNILPLDKESLFRHIKSDVSGMTIPWLYVGMCFSTFCWHNEDHFAYSANYQHFGDTKTWYGVPGEDSYKFEEAMREEIPELFESQPDLLFQLVTLARPDKLRKAGVRVYAIDQHAGQFVITFPRAYHAGFNHGFNFNEAVNFAPQDWEPFGDEGVKRLRGYRKQPCFAHDELLLTAASRDHSIKTGKWLAPALERMRDEELDARKHFLETPEPSNETPAEELYLGPRYKTEPELIDPENEEEEVICQFCKAYCYLSRYRCRKTGKTLCLMHAGGYECCDALEFERYSGQNGEHVLQYRMTDDALQTTVRKVVDKASIPETWAAKVDSELDDNPRPSLKHLRTLLAEGDKIQYDLPQRHDLRRFVERCNEWVEDATNYITRKQQNRRKNEKAWRKGTAKAAELEERDKELRKVDNIRKLLATADDISFDCPEINTLRERAESIADFQRDANAALNNIRGHTTVDFEELMDRGKEFHVDIPEIDNLERVVKRLRWDDLAKIKRPNMETRRQDQTLKDIDKFIAEGVEIGVPDTNPDMLFFREHKAQGELWEQKAKELMAVEQVHYQQLDSLATQATTLPVSAETLAAVDAILRKQREVQEKIAALVEQSKNPDFRQRPMYKEMRTVMETLEELQSKPNGTIELEKLQKQHEDWMREGKKLFGKANAPLHILLQHMMLVNNRNESCFDLTDKPRMPVEPSSRSHTPEEGQPIADGSNSSRDVFCICRKSEAGMMIECEICHEWYHGKCLKIARGKVKEDDKYTCPICDWRVKIPRDAARPKLEDLLNWQDKLETLPFQPEEEATLNSICEYGVNFREFMKPLCNPENPTTPEEVNTLRFYLRKIDGADILLADETNYLKQELHKWCPVAPEPPPRIDVSGSTRKPRPTKQQKMMAQLGITNPAELPQQFKLKPHGAKSRKDSMGKNQPLQPANGSPLSPIGSQPFTPGSSTGPSGEPTQKKFLTPLAIQVMGEYAGAPVVSQMLQAEPHMNSEKLSKIKAVLMQDPSTRDIEPEAMKKRIANLTPSQLTPTLDYGSQSHRNSLQASQPSTSSYAERPMFSTATESTGLSASQPAPLGSPTTLSPAFDTNIFDGAGGSMFEMSASENRNGSTSPQFEGRAGGSLFDSPKPTPAFTQAGINSPGFGGSQQSAGNIDNVFADLVHDHDVIASFDGSADAKDDGPAEEAPTTGETAEGDSKPTERKEDVVRLSSASDVAEGNKEPTEDVGPKAAGEMMDLINA
jgi:[histone H3]-trimethyl-L-lysine4 demethylase